MGAGRRPLTLLGRAALVLVTSMGALTAACSPGNSGGGASATRDPGSVVCPEGRPARAGLDNFGAYIGTWQSNRPHDSSSSANYLIRIVPGYVAVRCSDDGFVVQEEIHPRFQAPAGQALRIALTDIPDDSNKVYDHTHAGCRVFQYTSSKLAHQLGADDADGRVDIVFESESGAYNPASVRVIVLDLFDRLGTDTRDC